uniref:Uncharacterized protein n=1 Tax=Monodelphis domestica TaxID=13616 RepID=K7E0E8_MONDO
MVSKYGPDASKYLEKWQAMTKANPKVSWPRWGSLNEERMLFLQSVLSEAGQEIEGDEREVFNQWLEEYTQRKHRSERSVEQETGKNKRKVREEEENQGEQGREATKKQIADLQKEVESLKELLKGSSNPATSLDSIPEPLESPEAPIPQFPFKIKGREGTKTMQVSFTPWTKTELRAMAKEFPKARENPIEFAKEFELTLSTYQPGLSDLYQLAHILVGSGDAAHWFKTASWENPLEYINQLMARKEGPEVHLQEAKKMGEALLEAIPKAFPKSVNWGKIQTCTQKEGESVFDFYNRFLDTFRANSGLSPDSPDTLITFNTLYVEGLNKALANLLKRGKVDWNLTPTFQILTAPIIAYDLPQLEEVPSSLWATDSSDIGRILSAPPIQVQLDPSKPLPRVPQYPLSREATEGIRPLIDNYLEAGILIKCTSPCNSPILGVRKPGGRGWRLVQDLRAVNACVIPRAPVVPNPHNLLNQIPHSAKIFTVVDLCSAYFSVPLHADSQFLFAFTWEGIQLCWTVLLQGYTESATYFSQVLKADLAGLKFPFGSTLLQYVDDLLLCSPDAQSSREDSIVLLKSLAQKGHKVSKEKMQFVSSQVKFLGHLISAEGRSLDPARVAAILNFPRPKTKRQLRGFMGLAGYCRLWVPSFSLVAKPLFDLLKASSPEPLIWNEAAKIAFMDLKSALSSSPALGRPNYSLPFHLFLLERNGISLGVLSQKHGDHFRPLGYYSKSLDSVARGLPSCLRAVVAASDLLELVEEVTLESPLTLHVPHAIEVLLNSHHTQHFSTSRLAKLEASLLAKSNITISRCKTLNPATFLPDIEESDRDCTEGHDCVNIVDSVLSPREDLQEKELENPDFSWYTDGSCLRNESGILVAGYAITTTAEVIEAGHLPSAISAQQAELEAVTRACELAKGKRQQGS